MHKPPPKNTPPWKTPKTKGKSTPLTPEQKEEARARAQAAGRRYPNLVDNMWVAKKYRDTPWKDSQESES